MRLSTAPLSDVPIPMSATSPSSVSTHRTPQRVRHDLRFRKLQVVSVVQLTPHMLRVTIGGEALAGFSSPGFDDHAKLVFPDPVTGELVVPTVTDTGVRWPDGPRPAARDYTPRHYDADAGTLAFDFALHEAGPATAWALAAQPGDVLGVGGPRGSLLVPTAFDWHLLVGDDTALPAIARRLTELPADSRAVVVVEVDSPADVLPLASAADVTLHWCYREGAAPGTVSTLLETLTGLALPVGDYYAWVACESAAAKAIRAHLVAERGAQPGWIKASGYWRRGQIATHETHQD